MKIIAHRASQRTVSHETRAQQFYMQASTRGYEQRIAILEQRIAATHALIARIQSAPDSQPISELIADVQQTLDTCDALDRDLGRKIQALKA